MGVFRHPLDLLNQMKPVLIELKLRVKVKKKTKKILILIFAVVVMSLISVFASLVKFDVPNPLSSGIGLVKIIFTETEYIQLQDYPKVYLAKPYNSEELLINFMKRKGYEYLEDERIASTLVFGNGVSKQYVDFSVNAYYSKWVFRE